MLAAGVLLLNLAGNPFIREITREATVERGEESVDPRVGKSAPHFAVPDLGGVQTPLSDFLGSPVILTFWTTWNREAADQIRILDLYLAERGEALAKVIAVNSQEDRSVVASFMRRGGYRVRVLLDEKGEVGERYGARNLPRTYFIDSNGVIRKVFTGIMGEKMLVDNLEELLREE